MGRHWIPTPRRAYASSQPEATPRSQLRPAAASSERPQAYLVAPRPPTATRSTPGDAGQGHRRHRLNPRRRDVARSAASSGRSLTTTGTPAATYSKTLLGSASRWFSHVSWSNETPTSASAVWPSSSRAPQTAGSARSPPAARARARPRSPAKGDEPRNTRCAPGSSPHCVDERLAAAVGSRRALM